MATGDVTFALRPTSLNAHRSFSGATSGKFGTSPPVILAGAGTGIIGDSLIDCDRGSTGGHALYFPGNLSVPSTKACSVLLRCAFGVNNANLGLWSWNSPNGAGSQGLFGAFYVSTGIIRPSMFNESGTQGLSSTQDIAWTPVVGTYYDLVWTFTGDTTANGYKFYVDGVLQGQGTATQSWPASRTREMISEIILGLVTSINSTRIKVNEFVIFEGVIDPTNVTLTSGAGSLNGATRSAFVNSTALDYTASADPGVGNVKTGVGYTILGTSLTGTYTGADRWSDPGQANVLSGTSYLVNGATVTGSYNPPTSTNPGASNVASGVSYIISGTTYTGSLVVPSSTVVNSTIDLGALVDNIKTAFDDNNVAVGAPVGDLSSNMSRRVMKVATINPEQIMPKADILPAVCVYVSSKTPKAAAINVQQSSVKRQAKVVVTIAGLVWNPNYQANIYDDKTARDLGYLMENIEKVLRGYPELSYAKWQFPTDVTYHSVSLDEQTHFRVGFMDVEFTFFY